MEVLYHIRPYFVGICPYIGLKNRPHIYGIGTSNQSVPVAWPLKKTKVFSFQSGFGSSSMLFAMGLQPSFQPSFRGFFQQNPSACGLGLLATVSILKMTHLRRFACVVGACKNVLLFSSYFLGCLSWLQRSLSKKTVQAMSQEFHT